MTYLEKQTCGKWKFEIESKGPRRILHTKWPEVKKNRGLVAFQVVHFSRLLSIMGLNDHGGPTGY